MKNNNKRNVVIGFVIVLIVSLVLLNAFNLLGATVVHYLLSWKTLLVIVGLALVLLPKHRAGGIILTSLGVIFWLPELSHYQFQLREVFLPSLLIVIGVIMLLRSSSTKKRRKTPEKITRVKKLEPTQTSKQDI